MDYLVFVKAFVVGGVICVIGQILIDNTKLTPGKILVGFVVIGVVLGGLGIYQPLVKWAEAGATVPLSGFGCALAEGTKKAIKEDGLMGIITGPLCAGSAGIMAAILSGLIASFITKPSAK
ncbi:MAG: stage V sporulation protein AE [Oscillospiraceae bacterium]